MAEALPGAIKRPRPGREGLPGCMVEPGSLFVGSNEGESIGEENDKR